MKVITHGNTYNIVKCPKCKADLAYVDVDLKKEEQFINGVAGYTRKVESVICPECGNKIEVKSHIVKSTYSLDFWS